MDNRKKLIEIAVKAISELNAEKLLKKELSNFKTDKKLILISIGKAAWQMAKAAVDELGDKIEKGFVITKYQHSLGEIEKCRIFEAGHPLPDKNSIKATEFILKELENLSSEIELLFLISGGGSALFEKPLPEISLKDLIEINRQLINSGAAINEINTVRKHLSEVKGGRFAARLHPRRIHAFILSDVIGDKVDLIASGPVHPDQSSGADALKILRKYRISFCRQIENAILSETPKILPAVQTSIIGNCGTLCDKAAESARQRGYDPIIITKKIQCDVASAADLIFDNILKYRKIKRKPFALILGGETVVKVTGKGKGGRNQHFSLYTARKISGMEDVAVLSIASDGTDGPTDAAGGCVDGTTWQRLAEAGIDGQSALRNNDSYHALKAVGDLIVTGPTGTNVNDLTLVLIK